MAIACVSAIIAFCSTSQAIKLQFNGFSIENMPTLRASEVRKDKASTELLRDAVKIRQAMQRLETRLAEIFRREADEGELDIALLKQARKLNKGKTGATVNEYRLRRGLPPL